jgi:hypothetical protein
MLRLLVLPANAGLESDCQVQTLAYLASSSATKKKSFITLTPGVSVKESLFLHHY